MFKYVRNNILIFYNISSFSLKYSFKIEKLQVINYNNNNLNSNLNSNIMKYNKSNCFN